MTASPAPTIEMLNPNATWWTYLARYDDLPGSVRVNMAHHANAPHQAFPYCLVFGTSYKSNRDDKLPEREEMDALNEAADELILSVMQRGPAIYAGTFTHNLSQCHYVYVQDAGGARDAFTEAHASLYPDREPSWMEPEDSDWSAYLDFLCPSQDIMDHYGLDFADVAPKSAKQQLVEVFSKIANETHWNIDGDLLWGHFFTSDDPEPLENATQELAAMGYRVVAIYPSDKDDEAAPDLWWLHVESIGHHSVDSLHERNQELEAFASERAIQYDGWDVGPVESADR